MTQLLAELKAYDWTYLYSDGSEYRLGLANAERLEAITSNNQELKDLMSAYSAFIWSGGEEPTVEVAATKTVSTCNYAQRLGYR